MKLLKKSLPIVIVTSLCLATVLPSKIVKAQEPSAVKYSDIELITPYNAADFDLVKYVEEMEKEIREETGEDFSAEVIDGTKVLLNTFDSENNPIEMIIDSETSKAVIDGEDVGVLVETEITVEEEQQASFSTLASSDWDPVYQYTINNTVKKLTGDLSKAAIYGTLFIAAVAAIMSGLGITVPILLASAKKFLASYGLSLALQLTGDIIDGKWSYSLYRTKKPVSTGGSKQYAYRYQNSKFSARFKVGKLTTSTWKVTGKTGGWWYGSRPY